MLDVKAWLETTTMKVAEDSFLKPPVLPYIVFTDETNVRGSDDKNSIADRKLSIELYMVKINKDTEKLIEDLLNAIPIEYKKNRTWIKAEMFFQTVYDFDLIEKI